MHGMGVAILYVARVSHVRRKCALQAGSWIRMDLSNVFGLKSYVGLAHRRRWEKEWRSTRS